MGFKEYLNENSGLKLSYKLDQKQFERLKYLIVGEGLNNNDSFMRLLHLLDKKMVLKWLEEEDKAREVFKQKLNSKRG